MQSNALSPIIILLALVTAFLLLGPYVGINFLGTPEELVASGSPKSYESRSEEFDSTPPRDSAHDDLRKLLGE